jgi:hypothetical protein
MTRWTGTNILFIFTVYSTFSYKFVSRQALRHTFSFFERKIETIKRQFHGKGNNFLWSLLRLFTMSVTTKRLSEHEYLT